MLLKLKALSHYDGDKETRFGDCILLYDDTSLVVYDCGHERHAEAVSEFLQGKTSIASVSVVVSHDHEDHTGGIEKLFEFLSDTKHNVTVYTSLYLRDARAVLDILDNGSTLPATKEHILKIFDNIAAIVNAASELNFTVENAKIGTDVSGTTCKIVGPTENEFAEVVAHAVETDGDGNIDGETVMNAASIQMTCKLDDNKTAFLCGDATPKYLHGIVKYQIIQLPHHGKLSSAEAVFDKIPKETIPNYTFLVSDNTGNNNGGADELMSSNIRIGKIIKNTKLDGNIKLGSAPVYATAQEASKRYGICAGL